MIFDKMPKSDLLEHLKETAQNLFKVYQFLDKLTDAIGKLENKTDTILVYLALLEDRLQEAGIEPFKKRIH